MEQGYSFEARLKEYELALSSIQSTNSVAYTGTGLFLTISLAGAAWFLRLGESVTWADVIGSAIAAVASIALILFWRRWVETLRVRNWISAFRAREIEAQLDLRHERYMDNVFYPKPHPCAGHKYLHTSDDEAIAHLRSAAARGIEATLWSPFLRTFRALARGGSHTWLLGRLIQLSNNASEPGREVPVVSNFVRAVKRNEPYHPMTVGYFWDALTVGVFFLWVAVVVANLVFRLA